MSNKPFIVYRSSAGSGKTFTLALVYLKLALKYNDPKYFRSILALTFTVKAAKEMKSRIIAYLSDIANNQTQQRKESFAVRSELIQQLGINQKELEKRAQNVLTALLHNYSDFQILTIDKFIARLTRSFASELNLSHDFEIEIDQIAFLDRVLKDLYEKVGTSDSTTRLLSNFLRFKLARQESIKIDPALINAGTALLSEDFFFIQSKVHPFNAEALDDLKTKFENDINNFLNSIRAIGEKSIGLIASCHLEDKDFFNGARGIYGYFDKLRNAELLDNFAPNSYVKKTIDEGKWVSSKGNPAVLDIKSQLEQFYNQAKVLIEGLPQILTQKAILNEIYTLGFLGELAQQTQEVRINDNIQLLGDLNKIIAAQMPHEQASFLFEKLGNKINHILIDEFQDTSALQWSNLFPLVEQAIASGNETLIVGDAKQSIYRFRGSESSLFNSLPNIGGSCEMLFKESYTEETLRYNYRSAKNIVNFNNRFFKALEHNLNLPMISDSFKNHEQEYTSNENGVVQWWISKYEANDKATKSDALDKLCNRAFDLVNNQHLKQSEICCLFRNNNDAAACASQLLSLGLNVVSEESLLLKYNPKVQLIIQSLECWRFPKDAFLNQKWLSRYYRVFGLNNYHELAIKLEKEKWSFNELTKKIGIALTNKTLNVNNAFSSCFNLSNAFKFDPNDPFIKKLLDTALTYEQTNVFLKKSFDEYWIENEDKLSISLPDNNDAVSVMTIHKSKGLEFPTVLVFLPQFGKRGTTNEYLWVEVNEPTPIGMTLLKTSDLKGSTLNELFVEEEEKSWLDYFNTLYVAFTRAENRLEIFTNDAANGDGNKLEFLKTWNEWDENLHALIIN
jgi:ATP-dependent exoDNAse (exonuclease V) beta subunit